jgi:hypothetical protein
MPQIPYILRVSLIFITNSVVQTNPSHAGRIANHRHCSLSIHFNHRFSFTLPTQCHSTPSLLLLCFSLLLCSLFQHVHPNTTAFFKMLALLISFQLQRTLRPLTPFHMDINLSANHYSYLTSDCLIIKF